MANNIEITMNLDISKTMDSLKELNKFIEKNLSETFEENTKKCQGYLEELRKSLLTISKIFNESMKNIVTSWGTIEKRGLEEHENKISRLINETKNGIEELSVNKYETLLAKNYGGTKPEGMENNNSNKIKKHEGENQTLKINEIANNASYDNIAINEAQLKKNNNVFSKYIEEKKNLQQHDQNMTRFWAEQTATTLQVFSNSFGELLGSSFGAEGFENIAKSIKEGFKKVLTAIIDSLSNMLYAGSLASLIKSLFDPFAVIEDAGKIVAGKLGLEILKGLVISMATGGIVTKPTLLMAGDAGAELYAPKQDFLTIARELILQERRNMPTINQAQQKVIFEVKNGEFKVAGRDLVSTVTVNQVYDKKRFAY